MRKIIVSAFASLDGVMQAPGGPEEDPTGGFEQGGWVAGYFDDVVQAAIGKIFSTPYELILGRTTYDIFAAHWPHITDPNAPDFPLRERSRRRAPPLLLSDRSREGQAALRRQRHVGRLSARELERVSEWSRDRRLRTRRRREEGVVRARSAFAGGGRTTPDDEVRFQEPDGDAAQLGLMSFRSVPAA